jgi:hypothetical protein
MKIHLKKNAYVTLDFPRAPESCVQVVYPNATYTHNQNLPRKKALLLAKKVARFLLSGGILNAQEHWTKEGPYVLTAEQERAFQAWQI